MRNEALLTTRQLARLSPKLPELARSFSSPFYDSSDPQLWREEATIIKRLLLGQPLYISRHYVADEDTYGVTWYWSLEPMKRDWCHHDRWYPRQWDGPVMHLMSRGIIRPVWCAGGAGHMTLHHHALAIFKHHAS